MCNPVSWWYVKSDGVGKLLISENTDSHTEASKEFGIRDTGIGQVCAGEFYPDPENPKPDLATWKLVWDYAGHTRRPDWMDEAEEIDLRAKLEDRCRRYVFTDGQHEPSSCRAFAFGSAHLVCKGTIRVEARGSSSVEARGSSRVEARDSSSVVARDSSSVVARSAYADICGREPWDGQGYKPLRCDIKEGLMYSVKDGQLVAVTQ